MPTDLDAVSCRSGLSPDSSVSEDAGTGTSTHDVEVMIVVVPSRVSVRVAITRLEVQDSTVSVVSGSSVVLEVVVVDVDDSSPVRQTC